MVAVVTQSSASRLSDDEASLLRSLRLRLSSLRAVHRKWDAYYQGTQ